MEFLQVILCNKGDIDAVYNLVPSSTQFGSQFTFSPAQGIVMPGGYQAIQVKISFPFYLHTSALLLILTARNSIFLYHLWNILE